MSMSARELNALEKEVLDLEREVALSETSLGDLRSRLRVMTVEADAARDPAQFRAAALERRGRPGGVAAFVGFIAGVWAGGLVIAAVAALVGG